MFQDWFAAGLEHWLGQLVRQFAHACAFAGSKYDCFHPQKGNTEMLD
jgi:hypothetical protein